MPELALDMTLTSELPLILLFHIAIQCFIIFTVQLVYNLSVYKKLLVGTFPRVKAKTRSTQLDSTK